MGARFYVYDVIDLAAAPALVERVTREVGPIDCFVNNAGIHLKKPALETTSEEFEKVLRTHGFGSNALVRAVAPEMIERKRGSILFIASMASLFGIPQVIAYTVVKSAYVEMVEGYATELSPLGIRVNVIAPGWIETEMSRSALNGDPARKNKVLGRTPLAKFGTPGDVGWAAVDLASPAASFVTGVMLLVDGDVSIGF